jgi:hypothetical protein
VAARDLFGQGEERGVIGHVAGGEHQAGLHISPC